MTAHRPPHLDPRGLEARKPRVLIAGEFSSGKTSLVNGLTGKALLPANITATALPPVWLTAGAPLLAQVGRDDAIVEIPGLADVNLRTTHYCLLRDDAPILQSMDLIDTPGNSDPNMAAETWQNMLDFADIVVWCTNATQAWRQSEKAVWEAMPNRLRQRALLLITHGDLLDGERSARRLLARVNRDASPYFAGLRMASLEDRDHIANIMGVLQSLCARLAPLASADAPPPLAPEAGGQTDQALAPPRTNALAQTAQTCSPAKAPPPAPATAPGQSQTNSPSAAKGPAVQPVHITRPSELAKPPAPVRALWNKLAGQVDRGDPAAILQAVERLITTLDAPAQRPDPQRAGHVSEWRDEVR